MQRHRHGRCARRADLVVLLLTSAFARHRDPDTSHDAADSVRPTVTYLENKVLFELELAGDRGMTLDQLIDATGLDKVTVSPRLRPLRNKGLAREAATKREGKSGRLQTVWVRLRDS
jgi:hypothetical protein